jgi:hypothetical protein
VDEIVPATPEAEDHHRARRDRVVEGSDDRSASGAESLVLLRIRRPVTDVSLEACYQERP